jgi:hypothetical protein
MLRRLGCALPVELWHLGPEELDESMRALVDELNVRCVDVKEANRLDPIRRLGGWESKAYAIVHSRFAEVIYLDADNGPLVDPERFFETPQYRATGAIFWPDCTRTKSAEAIWRSCGVRRPAGAEFESGQMVVDKRRCWRALQLAIWFNAHSDFYYQHLLGDKETFHLAFELMDKSYALAPNPVRLLAGTMCQHDFRGRRVFQHRNMDKWDLLRGNRQVAGFRNENLCREFVAELRARWDGGESWYWPPNASGGRKPGRGREVNIEACMITCGNRAKLAANTLASLAASDWGGRSVLVVRDNSRRGDPQVKQTTTAWRAIRRSLRNKPDYILFLEDDLIFNRHLLHNLMSWAPVREGVAHLASVYNPGLREAGCSLRAHWVAVKPKDGFGSQALLISRELAEEAVESWESEPGMQDLRLGRLAARRAACIYYHWPSLVQHVGRKSTWGGVFHSAFDFDPEWRAGEADGETGETR